MKTNPKGDILLVYLYVDDLVFTVNNLAMIQRINGEEFEMTNLGLMAHFSRLEVKQDNDGIFISQIGYAQKV